MSGNGLLPWSGELSHFCAGEEQDGAPCELGKIVNCICVE